MTTDSLIEKLQAEMTTDGGAEGQVFNSGLRAAIGIVRQYHVTQPTKIQDNDSIAKAVSFALINAEPFTTEEVSRVALARLDGALPIKRKPEPMSDNAPAIGISPEQLFGKQNSAASAIAPPAPAEQPDEEAKQEWLPIDTAPLATQIIVAWFDDEVFDDCQTISLLKFQREWQAGEKAWLNHGSGNYGSPKSLGQWPTYWLAVPPKNTSMMPMSLSALRSRIKDCQYLSKDEVMRVLDAAGVKYVE